MTAYVVADDVAWVDAATASQDSFQAFVARLPDGPPVVLTGPAWLIWTSVVETPRLDDVVAAVSSSTGAPVAEVAGDVAGFLEQLVAQGLLRRDEAQGSS